MADRFDLEQGILQCWGVTDDLRIIVEDKEMSADEIRQLVEAISVLFDYKFQKCFSTFETLIRERKV